MPVADGRTFEGSPAAVTDGVLVVDKPPGMTSHDVVAVVRRILAAPQRPRRRGGTKVGHAGTLDPEATGVLVVCVGRATRLVPFLQASTKTYDARMRLGVTTSTLDAAGDVLVRRDASALDEAAVRQALRSFVGGIRQVPPMVSAVKVGGERLYARARRGEEVERPSRPVTIDDLVLTDFSPGPHPEAHFVVTCSAGTYVRTLAADVGERLGVGAHLTGLRRLASGRFCARDAVDLDTLRELGAQRRLAEVMLTPAQAVADHPTVVVDEPTARDVGHGRPVPATGHPGPVALLDGDGRLLAMVADRDGRARPLAVLAPAGPASAGG